MLGLPVLATSAAAASENPYASSTITKIYDGTGQGTPDGTFINSENGYSPGDNTPDDGVVASNDYVGYQVETRFAAGPERTVVVSFDVPEYLRLDAAMNPGICQSNSFVTGTPVTSGTGESATITGCSYKVKRGVGVTVQHNLIATALDTAGTAQYDQVLTVATGLQGQEPYSSNAAEAVTVVSAPTADLVLRPSTCTVSGVCNSITSSKTTGSLIVMVDPLKWPGYNTTKGASVLGEWTAQLDVSDFPAGTTWSVGGVALTATNGILNLGPYVGQQTVNFTAPTNWGGEEFQEGESRSFDAHLIVPDTAFETDSYLNNGTGWEPGQGEPSGFNTLDDRGTGARKGYIYANNDWTKINVYKPVPVRGQIFTKQQYRPWDSNQTLWEDGNKEFASVNSTDSTQNSWDWYWTRERPNPADPSRPFRPYYDLTPGTELLTAAIAYTQNITGPTTQGLVLSDEWDTNYVAVDSSRDAYVTGPDGAVIKTGFTIQWSTTVTGDAITRHPLSNSGWIDAKQPVDGARSVRAIFDSLPSGTSEGAGQYTLWIPTKVKSDLAEPDIPQITTDTMRGWCEGCTGGGAVVVPVSIITMGTPKLGITVKTDTPVIPGDTGKVSYTVTPTVDDLLSSTDPLNGTLTLTLDACVNSYALPTNSPWELVSEDMPLSCGDSGSNTVVLKLKSDWNPSLSMKDGKTTLPKLVVDTVWSKLTENNGSLSAEWALTSIDGVQSVKVPDVVPVTGSATVTVSPTSVVGQQITTSTPKVEIDEVLKYQAVVEAAISGQESVSANSTVVVMPGRGNDAAYRAQFTEYFDGPESSDFHGTYVVSKVSVSTKDSVAGTTVQCTTDANPSLDPSVNTWGSCTGSTLENATAVKINQPGGNHQGISVVDIELTPSDNERGDNYLMWIGGVTGANINADLSLPANDEVVASDINGYVYWDIWGRGADRNADSPGIQGVTVQLLDSSGAVVTSTTTDETGFYEFIGYHSGDYTTRLPALGATGGVPATMPSAFYPDKQIDVKQTYSYAGQRLDNSKLTSTKIALGIDALVSNVNFGFYAPDPYSDLMKSATQVRCTDDSVVCDVTWDVTVKNGGTPFEPSDILGSIGDSPNGTGGSAIWTSDGYYIVKSNGDATKATGLSGTVLGATGANPRVSSSAVWTTDGYYLVNGAGVATKATGISGTILGAIGKSPTSTGSGVWTSDGYYVVNSSGVATNTGISGTILGATGNEPTRAGYGSAVWTSDGYYLVNSYGTVTEVVEATGLSGTVLGATGDSPVFSSGSAVWTADGYYVVKNTGVATEATGISGTVLGATGTSPVTNSSAVWTTDGYYLVNVSGGATEVTGLSGAILGATGSVPRGATGSAVWTTDGYYVVKNTGVATKATGLSDTVRGATGTSPVTGTGSAVWTSDKFYIVKSNGIATEADIPFPKAPEFTGSPITLTGGKLTDSTSKEVYDLEAIIGEKVIQVSAGGSHSLAVTSDGSVYAWGYGNSGQLGNGATSSQSTPVKADFSFLKANRVNLIPLIQSPNGDFITREYQLPNLAPGEEVTVTLTGKVNKPNFEASGGKGIVIGNQAWEVFTQTQRPAPNLPSPNLPTWNPDDPLAYGKWTGNSTCTATENWVVPGDQCDQVYASVPTTDQELGALSGYLWFDQNDDGIMQPGEPRLVGQKVVLYQGTNGEFANKRGETFTDENGFYDFTSLVPSTALEADGYYVSFELAANPMLSAGDDLLGEGESWAWTTAYDQDPWYAVDRSASFDGLTHNVPVVASQTTTPVNGGVIVTQASITVVKGSVKGPETENLPNAGNGSDPHTVNITFTNNGREPLTNLTWEDETLEGPALTDLVCLYQDAEIAEDTVLPVGESVTCTATLPGMPYGEMHRDEFTVNAVGTISGTPVTDDDEWSATTDGVPSWTLAKTSDPASGQVGAGEPITYYLMAANTGDLDLDGTVATDDMSRVVWDEQGNRIASMTTDPAVLAARGLTYEEDEESHTATLTWDIPAMRAGAGTSVNFTVTIAENAFGKTFINNVTGDLPGYDGDEPLEPQQCYPDWFSGEWTSEDNPNGKEPCGTTHTTPKPPVAPTLPPLGGMGQWVFLLVGLGVLGGVAVYAYRYESARKARIAMRA